MPWVFRYTRYKRYSRFVPRGAVGVNRTRTRYQRRAVTVPTKRRSTYYRKRFGPKGRRMYRR